MKVFVLVIKKRLFQMPNTINCGSTKDFMLYFQFDVNQNDCLRFLSLSCSCDQLRKCFQKVQLALQPTQKCAIIINKRSRFILSCQLIYQNLQLIKYLKLHNVFIHNNDLSLYFKFQLELINKQSCFQLVHENNQCLQEKLVENNTNCRNLSELEKGILAFKMMNCHYQRAGRKIIECNFDDLPSCTRKLDSNYWNIFTQFYILVQHLCQIEVLTYLQSNVDKNLINIQNDQQFINENLNTQLNKMADIIYFQNVIQNNTNNLMTYIQSQYNHIDLQRNVEQQKQSQLLDQMNLINQQINQYHEEIDNSFQELSFYYQIIKHYVDLIYNQELRLHQILFYFADLIVLWILTSNRRLQEQRFTGFTFLLISLLFELFEFRYTRQVLVANQLILFIYGYFSYKDYEELTYNKLRSIERKMAYFDLSNFKKKARNLLMSTARKLNLNN